MNRMLVIGVAAVLALGVAAVALATTGGGNGSNDQLANAGASNTPSQISDGAQDSRSAANLTRETQKDLDLNGPEKQDALPGSNTNTALPADGQSSGEVPPSLPADQKPQYDRDTPASQGWGQSDSKAPPDARDVPSGGNIGSGTQGGGPDTPVSSDDPPSSPGIPAAPDGNRELLPAPIESLDILVMESFPPQYLLNIVAGLPSGCAEKGTHEVTYSGNEVRVAVLNSVLTGDVACTMIYGIYEVNINLGSDFVSGQTYTVYVNDAELTFTAQ